MRVAAIALSLATAVLAPGARAGSSVILTPYQLIGIEYGEGHYHLWAVAGGTPHSLGPFNMENATVVDPATFQPIDAFVTDVDLSAATEIWVTVEAETAAALVPSKHHVLAGPVANGHAQLSTGNPSALGLEFSEVFGGFVIDTPTTATMTDSASGIWFLLPDSEGPDQQGLTMPPLPDGWGYETWITDANSNEPIPMSMGAFDNPNGPDVNAGGGGAGPDPAPPFPGQDFIHAYGSQPVLPNFNKGRWTIVVSIEPKPNTGPSPFHSLEPLRTLAIQPVGRRVYQALANTSDAFPTAYATITTSSPVRPVSWGTIKGFYR